MICAPANAPTNITIILTIIDIPTPRTEITEPAIVPSSTSAADWAIMEQGTRMLEIFPERNPIYVPGMPKIGKYEIGSTNQNTAEKPSMVAKDECTTALIGGIAFQNTAK